MGAAWPSLSILRAATAGALDLILPPRPLDDHRDAPGVQTHGLSPGAWARIAFIEAPACDGCGAPFDHDPGAFVSGAAPRCAACQTRKPAFDHGRAACVYDEHSRDLILKLKHADRTDLAGLFATWLARAAADILPQLDMVAPVPLHPGRLLRRRYNQAAEIARPLARRTGLKYLPDALIRRRDTGSQGGRSGVARRRNVAGAFMVARGWEPRLAGARVLLVDDVLTTGATAEGCARALKAAGAARVDLVVIARVKELTTRPI